MDYLYMFKHLMDIFKIIGIKSNFSALFKAFQMIHTIKWINYEKKTIT